MLGEDILGQVLSCFGAKDDTIAKGLLAGKVRQLYLVIAFRAAIVAVRVVVILRLHEEGDERTLADAY